VRKKFIKEEDLSYNVVFPRWIWRFIHGLFLNPLTFVLPKYEGDMGRICVDGTNSINDRDDGAPNSQIPKPGTPGRLDENPAIAYGTAFQRFLTWLYNVRLDWPYDDILMLPDDISAAFHQLFYHPRMMPVFASVFEQFLCVPAGTIFGSRSSPGYYMLPGELRAWLAGALPLAHAQVHIMDNTTIPSQPSLACRRKFAQATRDALNQGAAHLTAHGVSALYPVFVDDTGNAHVHHLIESTVTASVISAYLLFGFPGGDTWAHRPRASTRTNGTILCPIKPPF